MPPSTCARNSAGKRFLVFVEQSDVLVENNSAKVLPSLGLGTDVLMARNPRLIVVRMPSLGLSGPYAHYVGFGAHVEALCGLTARRGYRDLDVTANAGTYHMDASGTVAAFAVLAALRRREKTGVGEVIELAQSENLLQHIGEEILDASVVGFDRERLGNRHPTFAPQGVYPCAGEDPWIANSVTGDAAWRSLRSLLGEPSWVMDPALETGAGRWAGHDDLDAGLARWTMTQDRDELFHRCQAAGIAAGAVLDESDLLVDPQLSARGFFRKNSSEDLGEWTFPGHLWQWDGPPLQWGRINRMGADNDYVWRDVAGLEDETCKAMQADGQLRLDYVDGNGDSM